ncbi:MAG: hypothetical protein RLZZ383_2549, partial [Pseudomonadota bacterium]
YGFAPRTSLPLGVVAQVTPSARALRPPNNPSGWVASFSRFVSGDGRQRCSRCCSPPFALAEGFATSVVVAPFRADRRRVSPAVPRGSSRRVASSLCAASPCEACFRFHCVRTSKTGPGDRASCSPNLRSSLTARILQATGQLQRFGKRRSIVRDGNSTSRPLRSKYPSRSGVQTKQRLFQRGGRRDPEPQKASRFPRPEKAWPVDASPRFAPYSAPDTSMPRASSSSCVGSLGTRTRSGRAHLRRSISSASRRRASGSSHRLRDSSGSSVWS